jgi:hypothetical protein
MEGGANAGAASTVGAVMTRAQLGQGPEMPAMLRGTVSVMPQAAQEKLMSSEVMAGGVVSG